ncbi:MAG: cupredoxin domain-containing protein [Nanoarchaeota archaeon]
MKNYMLMLGIISIFLISACSQQAEPAPTATEPKIIAPAEKTAESSPATAEAPALGESGNAEEKSAVPASNVKEFDMTARKWEFAPSTITVNEGDKVILNIKNEDVAHGFAIFEFDVNERLAPGETKKVEFTADKKGEYVFFCSVPCGTGHKNMKGKLIVE